jgi:hypothetical protein
VSRIYDMNFVNASWKSSFLKFLLNSVHSTTESEEEDFQSLFHTKSKFLSPRSSPKSFEDHSHDEEEEEENDDIISGNAKKKKTQKKCNASIKIKKIQSAASPQ